MINLVKKRVSHYIYLDLYFYISITSKFKRYIAFDDYVSNH